MRLSWTGCGLTAWSAILLAWWAPDAPRLVRELEGPDFSSALLALATLVALVLSLWVVVAAVLVMAGASSRLIGLVTPSLLRRALLAGAAGALAMGPAHADRLGGPDSRVHHSVDGLLLPDRPDARPLHAVERTPDSPVRAPQPHTLRVRPGDTLWAIAARALPDDASEAATAAAVRAWHEANRDVIGDDPDRIFPTQRLVPPDGKDHP
jgi:hypothetical protein